MDDAGWFGKLFQTFGPWVAAWSAACVAFVQYFKARNERHRDINVEKAGDWERIRNERDVACEERDLVRDRWAEDEANHRKEMAECEAEKLEWMARAVTAEAAAMGMGIGLNEATAILAVERLTDAAKKPGGEGGA